MCRVPSYHVLFLQILSRSEACVEESATSQKTHRFSMFKDWVADLSWNELSSCPVALLAALIPTCVERLSCVCYTCTTIRSW